jgi:hypothetical protein
MSKITPEAFDAAIKRIAMTNDGVLLNLWLQGILQEIPTGQDDGALQRDFGRRKFAADLKAKMDLAAAEQKNVGSGDTGIERLVVYSGRSPVGPERRSRRRV